MRAARADRFFAALLCAGAVAAGAADLGTLFHTPEERARLDRLRRGEAVGLPGSAEPERPRELTGFVKRSDGRHTVWIDGSPVQVSRPGAGDMLQPRAVGSHGGTEDAVKIERKAPR